MASSNELAAAYAGGGVLTASGPAPGDRGLRQTVAVRKRADGQALVQVETYEPTEWDTSVDEFEVVLASFDAALAWLETNRGIRADDLKLPRPR